MKAACSKLNWFLHWRLARSFTRAAGLMAVLLASSSQSLAESPLARPPEEDLKAAVERARTFVFKVECSDWQGKSLPEVLSAVAIDDDGFLVTVGLRSSGDRKVCVRDSAGKRYEARWIAADEATGLTLLKIAPGVVKSPSMVRGLPELGAAAIVVGNPFGLNHSVSVGNISGLDRSVSLPGGVGRGLIQFTAPVFPGDSGGILADRHGQMVGIVSTVLGEPGTENAADRRVAGIGFAIPAAELRLVAQRLRDGGKVERGYLGVTAEDVEPTGIRIKIVADGSPAALAGFQTGDVLMAFDDDEIRNFDQLADRIERMSPGTEVKFRVSRDGETMTLAAKLTERPPSRTPSNRNAWDSWMERFDIGARSPGIWDAEQWRRAASFFAAEGALLGVLTQQVSESEVKSLGLAATHGALVKKIVPSLPADRAGFRVSDVIVEFNDELVTSPQKLHELIQKSGPGAKVKLGVVSAGGKRQVEVTLAQAPVRPEFGNWLMSPIDPRISWHGQHNGRIDALEDRVLSLEKKLEEIEKRLQNKTGERPSPSTKE